MRGDAIPPCECNKQLQAREEEIRGELLVCKESGSLNKEESARGKPGGCSDGQAVVVNYECAVGVAQLVERRSVAPNVAGSIPVSHPNLTKFAFPFPPLTHQGSYAVS